MPRLTDKERTAIANELVRRVDTVSLLYSSCRLRRLPWSRIGQPRVQMTPAEVQDIHRRAAAGEFDNLDLSKPSERLNFYG